MTGAAAPEARELGALAGDGATIVRAWAPHAKRAAVRLFAGGARATATQPMRAAGDGEWEAALAGVGAGALYKLVIDDRELPDPYARFLPFGVDGPAEVIARGRGRPLDPALPLDRHVVYELHVGTFTPEGTYAAAAARLEALADLGVTAIELMPLSSFPGRRGWGYDGVAHFAPYAPYGRPEELRALIDRAHGLGIAVLLDVVYNHFGPAGNYLGAFAPEYFTDEYANPWGDAPAYREPRMRRYVIANARMWFEEYGFDGLRLDATATIHDSSPTPILRELRRAFPGRVIVAEDDRNDPSLVRELGLDAIWTDDFHHQLHVVLTREDDGYYAAYEPELEALARVVDRGWLYEGQRYAPWDAPRGNPPGDLAPRHLVYYAQNHDQVGNRALGDRLPYPALRAATALLLFLPATPLLFMGQEWAASTPFLFFTDHDAAHGPLVSKGRREEFKRFRAFAGDVPDPQAASTFERSKLYWGERERAPHRTMLGSVRALLALRRELRGRARASARDGLLYVERDGAALVANLSARALPFAPPAGVRLVVGEIDRGSIGAFSAAISSRP